MVYLFQIKLSTPLRVELVNAFYISILLITKNMRTSDVSMANVIKQNRFVGEGHQWDRWIVWNVIVSGNDRGIPSSAGL